MKYFAHKKLSLVVPTCDPSTWAGEARESGIQGSVGYMRSISTSSLPFLSQLTSHLTAPVCRSRTPCPTPPPCPADTVWTPVPLDLSQCPLSLSSWPISTSLWHQRKFTLYQGSQSSHPCLGSNQRTEHPPNKGKTRCQISTPRNTSNIMNSQENMSLPEGNTGNTASAG